MHPERGPVSLRRALRRLLRAIVHPLVAVGGMPVSAVLERMLRLSSRQAGIALIYHSVDPVQGDLEHEIVPAHGSERFAAQVRHLKRRYRIVAADELLAAAARRRRGEPFPVAITFDDDLRCHVDVVLPILDRHGATATFFLTGASLEGPSAFWWERLQRSMDAGHDPPLPEGSSPSRARPSIHEIGRRIERMSPAERDHVSAVLAEKVGPDALDSGLRAEGVQALVARGMSIGFHTLRHDPLPSLDDDALAQAMIAGRAELEAVTGQALSSIAYPHGHVDERVVAAARSAGFQLGFTTRPRPAFPVSNPLLVGRLNPSYRSRGHFALQLVRCLLRRPHQ